MNTRKPGVSYSPLAQKYKESFVELGSVPLGTTMTATLGLYGWQCFLIGLIVVD